MCGWTQRNAIPNVMAFRAAATCGELITYPSFFCLVAVKVEKVNKKNSNRTQQQHIVFFPSYTLFRLMCHFFITMTIFIFCSPHKYIPHRMQCIRVHKFIQFGNECNKFSEVISLPDLSLINIKLCIVCHDK